MKINYFFYVLFTLLFISCQNVSSKEKSFQSDIIQNEKIKKSVEYFLTFDYSINSYVVSDRDIDDFYAEKDKNQVIEDFSIILKNYDLTLYSQFTLACYLYNEGEKEFLEKLWKDHNRILNNNEFKPILSLLEHFKISLPIAEK